MSSRIDARLAELGITLPEAPAPAANYVPFTVAGGLVYISGQISRDENALITGKLGAGVDVAAGIAAARTCAIALIAQLKAACEGDLDRVAQVVKLGVFVNCAPDFTDQSKVANGASDVMAEVFGERGRHARFAVGVASLPLGVAVEADGVFAITDLPRAFLDTPVAHRGLHDRAFGVIENSRAAAQAAIAAGYGIELDVQRSADGEAMVFHDDELPRLTGEPGLVSDYSAAGLGRMPLLGSAETVPSLAEFLRLVAGRAPLLIEIKDQDGMLGPAVGPLEARVGALLRAYDGPVALMSFNPHSVAALAETAPDRPRGLASCDFEGPDWSLPDYHRAELASLTDFERTGAAFVSHDRRDLANPAIARLKARGVPVLCWTVRSPAEEAAARRVADNITFEGYRPRVSPRDMSRTGDVSRI